MTHERSRAPREQRHAAQAPQPEAAGGDASEALDALRERGDALLAASERAIEGALSGDSERFLRATRQHGGE